MLTTPLRQHQGKIISSVQTLRGRRSPGSGSVVFAPEERWRVDVFLIVVLCVSSLPPLQGLLPG